MRPTLIAAVLVAFCSSPARAEEDPRAIMREAAVEQAETTPPPGGPGADALPRSTVDGQRGREERALHGAAVEAHQAAISAAHAAASAARADVAAAGASASRGANARNAAADNAQRGAAAVAREHAVGRGRGHPGGRP